MININYLKIFSAGIVLTAYIALSFCLKAQSNDLSDQKIAEQRNMSSAASRTLENVLEESSNKSNKEDTVIIDVVSFGRDNPFKPYRKYSIITGDMGIPGVPADLAKDISPPPLYTPGTDNKLQDLMSSKVSGILYDPDGKSTAIINVKDADYMVRTGDSIFGFNILKINKNKVTLEYNNNTYSVSPGEVIESEGITVDPVIRNAPQFAGAGYKLPSINTNGF